MSSCAVEALPNEAWKFSLYVNGRSRDVPQIRRRLKFARCIGLTPCFPNGDPMAGIVVEGHTLSHRNWDGWGVYIDEGGALRPGKRLDEDGTPRQNWAAAFQCHVLDGHMMRPSGGIPPAAKEANGWTMIGFRRDGTPVLLCAMKGLGKSAREWEGITETQAVNRLLREKCVTVMSFCIGWKCGGFLRRQWLVAGNKKTPDLLLLCFRRTPEKRRRRGPGKLALLSREVAQKMTVRATAEACPVRSEPSFPPEGAADNVVGRLEPGQTVTVYELSGNTWGKIGTDRWVNVNLLE